MHNFSVCIPDISGGDGGGGGDGATGGDGSEPPVAPTAPSQSPPQSPSPPPVLLSNIIRATQLVSVFHTDQIPEIDAENSYPSCSYKPIKF